MKLVFAGTPEFAKTALAALVAAGHDVRAVLTRPDKPARRGQHLQASPVKTWAVQHGLPVWQPTSLRDPATWAEVRALEPQVMVVAAYGLMLPPEVLTIPSAGCLNIHASLLPRWRGAAPIQRAVQAGDSCTGITIMQMDEGLDTGAIRWVREWSIAPDACAGQVHDGLAVLGGQAIVEALAQLESGTLPCVPQPVEGVTYAAKLGPADQILDWHVGSQAMVDQIRAMDPAPGCLTTLQGPDGVTQTLKVWRAQRAPMPHSAAPGTVLAIDSMGIRVACGVPGEAVAILELQRPGGRRMAARAFLAGFPLRVGMILGGGAPPDSSR